MYSFDVSPADGFQSTHPARDATSTATKATGDSDGFQSTHPARDATFGADTDQQWHSISIHASREGCDEQLGCVCVPERVISIHASREGCDVSGDFRTGPGAQFQSTHPARDATLVTSMSI